MPGLGPGIGEQDEGAIDAMIGKPIDQLATIFWPDANIGDAIIFDLTKQLGDAFEKDLAGKNADVCIGGGLAADICERL